MSELNRVVEIYGYIETITDELLEKDLENASGNLEQPLATTQLGHNGYPYSLSDYTGSAFLLSYELAVEADQNEESEADKLFYENRIDDFLEESEERIGSKHYQGLQKSDYITLGRFYKNISRDYGIGTEEFNPSRWTIEPKSYAEERLPELLSHIEESFKPEKIESF